jgi:hypothetical protein
LKVASFGSPVAFDASLTSTFTLYTGLRSPHQIIESCIPYRKAVVIFAQGGLPGNQVPLRDFSENQLFILLALAKKQFVLITVALVAVAPKSS